MKILSLLALFATCFSFYAQAQKPNYKVVIHNFSDPDRLNPLTASSADASYIQEHIFSSLLDYAPNTLNLRPQLAVARPKISNVNTGEYKGGIALAFEIQKNAVWDNGTAVTAYDLIFTLKAAFNPLCNTATQRPYLNFISKIEIDKKNPKKFVVYCEKPYLLAESVIGSIMVMPEYIYDEKQIMRKYELKALKEVANENVRLDENLTNFAEEFNSQKFDRLTVVGSGEYKFDIWETGQFIRLLRKKGYWKDPKNKNQYPDTLIYKFVDDQLLALEQLKNGEIDVMVSIRPTYFTELKADTNAQKVLNFHSPKQYSYAYIGLNTKNDILADKQVRKALAHLIDRSLIIDELYQGLAEKTNSPINPSKSYYNKNIADIAFDIEKAKQILKAAGWEDTDGNSILDKVVNGEKKQLILNYKYNGGNNIRKNIGASLMDNAAKVGIKIELEAREWTMFLDDAKKRDFDLMSLAWVQSAGNDDLNQVWHSGSDTPEGSNRVGFNNPEADKIIDELKICMDEQKRYELYLKVQAIIAEEQAYIFLVTPYERIAINKKFSNTQVSIIRPHFEAGEFKLK